MPSKKKSTKRVPSIKKTSVRKAEIKKQSDDKKNLIIGLVAVVLIVFGFVFFGGKGKNDDGNQSQTISDYKNQDAKNAYDEIISKGYDVEFVFDRNNGGGYTKEEFQDFVVNNQFLSENYSEQPFTVVKQDIKDKKVILTIEYSDIVNREKEQSEREANLNNVLLDATALVTCREYGESHYRDFTIHTILGRIASYASDDDTWFFKYTADANGYENLTMECSVTGTNNNPIIKEFSLY